MKFSVGDPVYIKSTGEEGRLIEFVNHEIALIRTGNQDFHVYLEELEHPYLRWFLNKSKGNSTVKFVDQIRPEKQVDRSNQLEPGLYLVFFPQFKPDAWDEEMTHLKVYFYNETSETYKIRYNSLVRQQAVFSLTFDLRTHTELYLHNISFEEAASNPVFQINVVQTNNHKLDWDGQIGLKAKRFFQFVHQIRHENKPSFHLLVIDKIAPREVKEVILPQHIRIGTQETKQDPSHFDFKNALKKTKYEVDLHIEKLVKDFHKLDTATILDIQMRECQNALELASATHQRSLVLIHGIGNGKLREKVHSLLNQTKYVKRYVYDFDSRYGYGATEVFFS